MKKLIFITAAVLLIFTSCKKDELPEPTKEDTTIRIGPDKVERIRVDTTITVKRF